MSIIISIIIPNRVYGFSELQPKDGENVGAGGGGSSACSAPDSNCPCEWIGDQICDDVCNVAAHNFDNGDCCLPAEEIDISMCEACECLQ